MRRTKTKTKPGRFLALIITLCMICMTVLPVMAEDEDSDTTETLTATEDPRDSVMLIALGYEDDLGTFYDFKWGTCFLINDEYVLTNKHVVTMDDEEFTEFKRTFNVPDMGANDNHIKLYLYVNRDMRVGAKMHDSVNSNDMDFAAVKLSERIYDRKPIVLGDSSNIQIKDSVYAMGYPADSISNKEYNTKNDVSTVDGAISKVTETGSVDIIEHTAQLNVGNSGGPLLDEDNHVVGVNTFIAGEKSYSIQINAIKKALDTFGIPYVDGSTGVDPKTDTGTDTGTEQNPDTEVTTPDNSAIIASLQSVLNEAKTKAEEEKEYTEESIAKLNDCIGVAEAVLIKGDQAAEEEITTATDDLNLAITNLEEKSGPNLLLIGGIAAFILVIIIVIIMIVVISSGKKKRANMMAAPMRQAAPMPPAGPAMVPGAGMPMESEGAGETTLLDAGAGETTLLGSSAPSAYLIRKKNGEKIIINLQNFKIGKERKKVNYCVADNTTVSRLHCEIIRKGTDYYVVDMGSANATYVNGVQLSPHNETLLSDRSVLKLSDEEFEFHLS